jgi:TolB-like protein
VTLVIVIGWLSWDKLHRSAPAPLSTDKSIAVLPFDDFSPAGDQAWFADGLTEEILNSLARTADLQVASRTSSFAYRDSPLDIPTIAEALDVEHILEGSVRRSSDRLRVTAQLIRAADDKHLWSETFDGNNEDSIKIQEEFAFEIARALQTAMDPEELARMVSAGTHSVEAWETYLRALALDAEVSDRNDVARLYDVIAVFEEAVAIDPAFADAQLQLAEKWEKQLDPTSLHYVASGPSHAERRQHYERAIKAAIKHARSDMTRIEAEMRAAAFDVRIADQVALAERMVELEPDRRIGWAWLAYLYQIIGEYDKARDAGLEGWAREATSDVRDGAIIENVHRASPQDAVVLVDEALRSPNPTPNIIYQSHRALLAVGQIERAAGLIDLYEQRANDEVGVLIMQLRQACAEGRVADADALYEVLDPDSNVQWLYLKTLGFDDRARELLRPLDTPENLVTLSGYLVYRFFEPRDYPLLWRVLTAQDINRPPATPLAYRCQR